MKSASEIKELFPELEISENIPLKKFTTFRLGGPCPLLIDNPPADRLPALVQALNKKGIKFLVIGQGSNLVISDDGLDCAVIRFCSEIPHIQTNETGITVSGDTLLEDCSRITVEQALGDLAYCTGIPGTVGGGIAGNAGAFGRQIGDHLVSAEILTLDGTVLSVSREELEFSYRHSRLKETGEIVLSATFVLPSEKANILQAERQRILDFRKEHHPDWHATPCAGSVFKNIEPTSAVERRKAAGHFLEEAGAKTMTVGGARVFHQHANIIIGEIGCTAQNVKSLCDQMKQAVLKKSGIKLIPEVRFLGRFQ
ncbi:UDP-N-acetylmuramate dehydrogenase [Tichowtungia aerotolerans]|uniref:UDP-N-acetylenolpyruvoylglucosamine reductase n=1 Tax=Tichowtungia aerotolerans TaxID=2697043 RepID=A0A6P1M7S9_9BACT|nr:UDP-N-acetylmuramate dehydrogenase [Tichowtungia aerotolerans]QHI70769.1 UDP-N-acetylmuramate dehydrogenase [Tichowtungia aerotolerans]